MERYVIRGGQAGFERLQVLAGLRLPDTRDLFDRVGVTPGGTCIDLGSGSGDITAELARRVGPYGTVTGLDMDGTKLELARAMAASAGLANLTFAEADLEYWAAPPTYDLVYTGLVLQHLRDPLDLLRRMWAAVRPGGALVVEDADFDGLFCSPPNSGFDFYADRYREVLRRRGGDPAIGRKLCRLFLTAGIPDPQLTLVQRADITGPGKSMALSTLTATAEAILAEGLATAAEVDAAVHELGIFTDDPSTVTGEPRLFQVWARKPQA
jgi:SAM-dependent methyltransferase